MKFLAFMAFMGAIIYLVGDKKDKKQKHIPNVSGGVSESQNSENQF